MIHINILPTVGFMPQIVTIIRVAILEDRLKYGLASVQLR